MPNKFGGFDYDANHVILTDSPESLSAKLRVGDRVGEDGGYTGGGLQAPSRFTITGVVHVPAAGTPNIRQLWRALKDAHQPGTPRPLRIDYIGELFLYAEPEGITDVHASGSPFIGARQFEVTFYCADPFWRQNQEQGPQTLTLSPFISGNIKQLGTTNIFNGGSRFADPTISFEVTHPGTFAFTHDAGSFELYANLPGTYTIDSHNRFVTRGAASYHYRWDGVLPQLRPGQTSIVMQSTYGTAINPRASWFNKE